MPKPILIFDGDCKFCRSWARRGETRTGDRVLWVPYQSVRNQFPQISLKEFQTSVQFVDSDGQIFSGAAAVFRCLAVGRPTFVPLWLYRNIPGAGWLFEFVYRLVARHRSFLSEWSQRPDER